MKLGVENECEPTDVMTRLQLFPMIRRLNTAGRYVATRWMALAACGIGPLGASAVAVGQLRCEYLKDPLGIDVLEPRLSWVLEADKRAARGQSQSGYQILVASQREELEANKGD